PARARRARSEGLLGVGDLRARGRRSRRAVAAVRAPRGLGPTSPPRARPAHRADSGRADRGGFDRDLPADPRPALPALRVPGVQVRADLRSAGVRSFDTRARIYARLGRYLAAMLKGDSRNGGFQF